MALLNVDKLSVHFGDESAPFRAVDRISYSVKQGEVVGIVGESGSGKSVSSLAIMGLIDYPGRVMAEKLEFNGQDLQRISEKERRNLVGAEVAMIFQDPMTSLNPCYTVGFQIMEAIKVHQGGNKSTRRQRAIDLLNLVGIPDPASRLDVYPHQLSGGMSQRVMIAMAIACRPKLLIADEPTTALDVTIQAQIIELLLELQQQENMALVLITHDLALVAEAMRRRRIKNLAELYRFAFGRWLCVPAALVTVLTLVYAAAMPLVQLFSAMNHYVYVEDKAASLALYLLPCLLLLAWLGLEILGRTAKLFIWLLLLSFLCVFLIAAPFYEPYRLFPLLGDGLFAVLRHSAEGMLRFFPALLCLLICGTGMHGVENAASGAAIGAIGGGVVVTATQLLLGMAYPYYMLAKMPLPMYRMTMAATGARAYLRADKVLLFFWVLSGVIAGALLAYAAALLFAGVTRMRDIRPAVAALSITVSAVTLMGQMNLVPFFDVAGAMWAPIWLAALLVPLLAAMLALLRRESAA